MTSPVRASALRLASLCLLRPLVGCASGYATGPAAKTPYDEARRERGTICADATRNGALMECRMIVQRF